MNDASDADDEKEEAGAAHSFSWEGSGQEESGSSDRWGERNTLTHWSNRSCGTPFREVEL